MENEIIGEAERFLLCKLSDFNFNEEYLIIFMAIFRKMNKEHNLIDYKDLFIKYIDWIKTEGKHWCNEIEDINSLALAMLFIKDFELNMVI